MEEADKSGSNTDTDELCDSSSSEEPPKKKGKKTPATPNPKKRKATNSDSEDDEDGEVTKILGHHVVKETNSFILKFEWDSGKQEEAPIECLWLDFPQMVESYTKKKKNKHMLAVVQHLKKQNKVAV